MTGKWVYNKSMMDAIVRLLVALAQNEGFMTILFGCVVIGLTILVLLSLPHIFWFIGGFFRIFEPAEYRCKCPKEGGQVPTHLLPQTPITQRAFICTLLDEWPEIARIHALPPPTVDELREQVNTGMLTLERVALAAGLGDPASAELVAAPQAPRIRYDHWVKMPTDMQIVLRSGLPPRLCMVWALACVARALPSYEQEFHQDTRPRQYFGLALMILRDADQEAITAQYPEQLIPLTGRNSGCWILRRSLKERFMGRPTRGESARKAIDQLTRAINDYIEPSSLWRYYTPGDIGNGYMTPQNRTTWGLPCFTAENIAFHASQAAIDSAAELQWQRNELARMILYWERWGEDRAEWQRRVEDEWLPHVDAVVGQLPFDAKEYIALIRHNYLPWCILPASEQHSSIADQ